MNNTNDKSNLNNGQGFVELNDSDLEDVAGGAAAKRNSKKATPKTRARPASVRRNVRLTCGDYNL